MSVRRVRGSFRGSLRRYGSAESSRKPIRHHSWMYRDGEWRIAYDGHVLLKEVDCGDFSVRKAQKIANNLTEIKQQHEQKAPISFKDSHGRKNHSYICYYGSERRCHETMDKIKNNFDRTLGLKNAKRIKKEDDPKRYLHSIETIDLTEPANRQTNKSDNNLNAELPSIPLNILPTGTKIDYIFKSVGAISQDIINFRIQLKDLTNSQATLIEILTRDGNLIKTSTDKQNSPRRFPKPDKLVEAELTTQFIDLISKKRGSKEWRQRIRTLSFPDLSVNQNKNIKEILIYGSITVGSFMRSLAKELFGEERLLTTILGDHGEFLKGVKQQDRTRVFSVDDELKLIKILSLIDAEFFTSRDVYRFLVRDKINSYGRDLKKVEQSKQGNLSSKIRSHNITSFFKKISKPDDKSSENDNTSINAKGNSSSCHEPIPGPSGLQAETKGKKLLVDYNFSSQSSNEEY